jgi:aspartate racemase
VIVQTIGILGGFGPDATIDLERRILVESRKLVAADFNRGYPPVVSFHLRHPPIQLKDGAPLSGPLRIDPRVLEAAARLGSLVDFLIIGANTPHVFVDEISAAAGCDVVSMVDVVSEELARSAASPVGLLGLGVPQAYVDRFDRDGVRYITAATKVREALDEAILRMLEGRTTHAHREAARAALKDVRDRGATAIVLGCTEIPLLLDEDPVSADVLDPGDLVVGAAVRRAIG